MEINEHLKYGEVKQSLDNCPNIIEVASQILKVDISTEEEAKSLIMNIFRQFIYKKDDIEEIEYEYRPTNLAIYDGEVYSSGGLNATYFFNKVRLLDMNDRFIRDYPVIQLCDILNVDSEKTKAARNIDVYFPQLWEILTTFQPDLNDEIRLFINGYWNKGKHSKNPEQLQHILDGYLISYRDNFQEVLYEWDKNDLLIMVTEFINALHTIGIDTSVLKDNEEGIFEAFEVSKEVVREIIDIFLKEYGQFINVLDQTDGEIFSRELNFIGSFETKEYLNAAKILYYEEFIYYAHTEYLIKYQRIQSGTQSKPLYVISNCDLCSRCEDMLAKVTPIQEGTYNAIIISGIPYRRSRWNRTNNLVNPSFLLIQINGKDYWIKKFKQWRPYIEEQVRLLNERYPNERITIFNM